MTCSGFPKRLLDLFLFSSPLRLVSPSSPSNAWHGAVSQFRLPFCTPMPSISTHVSLSFPHASVALHQHQQRWQSWPLTALRRIDRQAPAQPQRHREAAIEPYPRERPASASLPDLACVRAPNYGCIMPVTTDRMLVRLVKVTVFGRSGTLPSRPFPLEDVLPNEKPSSAVPVTTQSWLISKCQNRS